MYTLASWDKTVRVFFLQADVQYVSYEPPSKVNQISIDFFLVLFPPKVASNYPRKSKKPTGNLWLCHHLLQLSQSLSKLSHPCQPLVIWWLPSHLHLISAVHLHQPLVTHHQPLSLPLVEDVLHQHRHSLIRPQQQINPLPRPPVHHHEVGEEVTRLSLAQA